MKRLAVTLWGPVKYDIIILIIQTYSVLSKVYSQRYVWFKLGLKILSTKYTFICITTALSCSYCSKNYLGQEI